MHTKTHVFIIYDIFINVCMTFVDGSSEKELVRSQSNSHDSKAPKKGMVLPFTPFSMSFDNMNYYVDMPRVNSYLFTLFSI